MQKGVIVTGCNGFLATYLIDYLLLQGYRVYGLIKKNSIPLQKQNGIEYFSTIREIGLKGENILYIFHLAAFIPHGKFSEPNSAFYYSNIKLTGELAMAFPSAKFVFASSVSVYGNVLTNVIDIQSPFNQPSLYGLSKIACEAIVLNHNNYAIIRFSSIIGVGMNAYSMIPRMIREAKQTAIITLWGDGKRSQNYMDVRDCVQLCLASARYNKCILTLGVGNRSYSNREVAEIISRYTGAKIQYMGEDDSCSFEYDSTQTYRELNFKPDLSLEQTISDMV